MSGTAVPTLADGFVLLDGHRPADVADHLAGEDEETAWRFGWWPEASTEQSVREAFRHWAEQWRNKGNERTFAVRLADTRELVGGCQLRVHTGIGFVSYWIFAGYRGQGFATRAVRLLCQYARSEFGLLSLEAHVASDNVASLQVARRSGFVHVADYVDDHGTRMQRLAAGGEDGLDS